jgi:membrane protein
MMQVGQLKEDGKLLFDKVGKDDVSGAAAELAYRFFLAMFPFFIFLAALGGFVADAADVQDPTQEVMNLLGEGLPADARSVIEGQLRSVVDSRNGGLLTISILAALWAASSGIGSLMRKLNRIFDVDETRSMPKKYGIAVGLTFLGAGMLVLAFVLFFVGQVYGVKIAAEIGLEGIAADLLPLARWPLVILLVMVAAGLLYWLAPNTSSPFRLISAGAIAFTLAWLAASYLFGIYVSNFGNYNATYGALGGVVILLLWFYLTAFLLLLGAEINALMLKDTSDVPQPDSTTATRPQDSDALVRPPASQRS